MATSVEQLTGEEFSFPDYNLDQHGTELCSSNAEATICNGNLPMFSNTSHGPLTSARESASTCIKYEYSASSRQRSDSMDAIDNEGGDHKSFEQKLMNSRSNVYASEKRFADCQPWSNIESASKSSMDALLGNNTNTYKQSHASVLDKSFDNKWEYSRDFSSYCFDKGNTGRTSEANKQKCDQFLSVDLNQSKSQSFDFELMKQTYSFDTSKNVSKSGDKPADKTTSYSRSTLDFENSDIAMRLRTSIQSDFLSSEFRHDVPPKLKGEDLKYESSTTLRTIEDILKQYGISDNAPIKSNQSADDSINKFTATSQIGHTNVSQNNEMSSALTRTSTYSSTQDKDAGNVCPTSTNNNINTAFRTDFGANTSYLDAKNSTNSTSNFSVNLSQNNETTITSQTNVDNDPLRKSGSSVDYSSGKIGPYSGGTSFKKFDYAKPTPFSGDSSRNTCKTYSCIDTKQFEGGIDKIKFEGSQVDVGKPAFNLSKSTPLDIIKNMGSATDALEYSMSTERQRLRKIDTMISATPFNYSSIDIPKSIRAQYMSPERTYNTIKTNDLTSRRIYSSSTIPTSSVQGTGVPLTNNYVGNVSQRETTAAISKSISAPGSRLLHVKGEGQYDSSVDGRVPYWSYGSNKDYNIQHNNTYNPQLNEKMSGQKGNNKNQKKPLNNKKRDCPLKNKKNSSDIYNYSSNGMLPFSPQTTTGISFLNTGRGDKISPVDRKRCVKQPEIKKTTGLKKNAKTDSNHSKNINNVYDGFDFVKDLNRMWKETVFGATSAAKSGQKQQKYMPYKPRDSGSDKNEEKSQKGPQSAREMFNNNMMQPSVKRSDSNWTIHGNMSTCGGYNPYESDLGYNSAQKIRSQCSIVPQRRIQQNRAQTTSSPAKQKTHMPSGIVTKQGTTPKSILKQPTNKSTGTISSTMSRPHSAMLTTSRSYTQPAYQLPYQLIRGFSPVDMNKSGRSLLSTSVKKLDSSTKRKPASRTPASTKQGRRI